MLKTTSDFANDLLQGSAYWWSSLSSAIISLEEEGNGSMQLPRSDVEDSLEGILIEISFTSDPLALLLEDIRMILYT